MTKDYFTYSGDAARHTSFPLGGIGTGSIGLTAHGRMVDWEIFNRPNKGGVNGFSHFAVRAEMQGKVVDARVLNGPYEGNPVGEYPGAAFRNFGFGATRSALAGMPHFEHCEMDGRFPVATLRFADSRFPGTASLSAFSPFIPMDDRSSSLPVAMFEVEIVNSTDEITDYTVIGALQNPHVPEQSLARHASAGDGVTGVTLESATLEGTDLEFGDFVLATDAPSASRQRNWYRGHWFDTIEVYWRDVMAGGSFTDRVYDTTTRRYPDHCTVAAHFTLQPNERRVARFAIAWHVPNCEKYWTSQAPLREPPKPVPLRWKNYYATQWADADAVAAHAFAHWEYLRDQTISFRDTLYGSSIPEPVLDAIGANLSTLKSPTVMRLADGTFYGWEGAHPTEGSCEGSCSHVWNYAQALPFLFPALERSMRDADFQHNQILETGGMAFRLSLPLGIGTGDERACADGQLGNVLKAYRDWKISGDTDWLRGNWPMISRALEFAWHPDNEDQWDPDRTGVLRGRQHHTLDMELFGPNAWLSGIYLAALKAAAEMASHLGETDRAAEYRAIFARGSAWVDENLFNGSYFIHQVDLGDRTVLDPFVGGRPSHIVAGDIYDLYWSVEHGELKYQMGDACGIDQLLGQWFADISGLGEVFEPAKIASALQAIYDNNFMTRLGDHYNPCRVFGMEEEAGTVICTFPEGTRKPAIPAPYAQETFHGCEYALGSLLMAHGEVEKGVAVFAAVRHRYRGHNRNPWNEIECGSNYARSMASYSALLALSGFSYDLQRGYIGFAPVSALAEGASFLWSAGEAWGRIAFQSDSIELSLLGGSMRLEQLGLEGSFVSAEIDGTPIELDPSGPSITFTRGLELARGQCVVVAKRGKSAAARRSAPTPASSGR